MPDDISLVARADMPQPIGRAHDGAARSILVAVCGFTALSSAGAAIVAAMADDISVAIGAAVVAGLLCGLARRNLVASSDRRGL